MLREYRHLQQYKKEILRLREEGLTHREIAKKIWINKRTYKTIFYQQSEGRSIAITAIIFTAIKIF